MSRHGEDGPIDQSMIMEEYRLVGFTIDTIIVFGMSMIGVFQVGVSVWEVIGGDIAVSEVAGAFLGHDQAISGRDDLRQIFISYIKFIIVMETIKDNDINLEKLNYYLIEWSSYITIII